MHTKETVRALLDRLPDDCTMDDVLYHLYVVQAVEQGRAELRTDHLSEHDQVVAQLRRKWLLGAVASEHAGYQGDAAHRRAVGQSEEASARAL